MPTRSKILFVICLICLLWGALHAQLSWPEPLVVGEYENLSVTNVPLQCPDGSQIVVYTRNINELTHSFMQAYRPESGALWAEPVELSNSGYHKYICLTSLGDIAVFDNKTVNHNSGLYLSKYNLDGQLIGAPDLRVLSNYATSVVLQPDHEGGIHVLGKINYELLYQYVSSAGSLGHPISGGDLLGVIPENNDDIYINQSSIMDDGSLMISYTHDSKDTLLRFDRNLGLIFRKTYDTESWYTYGRFALRSDGGFYAIWTIIGSRIVQSCNSAGEDLWDDPFTLDIFSTPYQTVCNEQNQLLFGWWRGEIYMAQCLDQNGDQLWQEGGVEIYSGSSFYDNFLFYPDNNRGYYVLRQYDRSFDMTLSVNYLNSDGTMQPWETSLSDQAWYNQVPIHSALVENGTFKIYHYYHTETESKIVYNEVNSAGVPAYPIPGITMESGSYGYVSNLTVTQFGPNRALAFWALSDTEYMDWGRLQYNLIDPAGGWVFTEPVTIISERLRYKNLSSYPTEDGGVLVTWWLGYNVFAQKINSAGALQWPIAKQILTLAVNAEAKLSYYNNSLYALIEEYSSQTLYLQRIVDGEPVWSGLGKPVATLNPGYQGNRLTLDYFEEGILIWGQRQYDEYSYMCFMKILDQDGESLEAFSESGLPIYQAEDPYLGIEISNVLNLEDRLWIELSLARSEYVWEGHSSGYWTILYDHALQSITDLGELLNPDPDLNFPNQVLGSVADDCAFYKATRQYPNSINIYKFGSDGTELWNLNPASQLSWQAYNDYDYGIRLVKASPTEFIGLGMTLSEGMYHQTYFTFSPEGQATLPPDYILYSSGTYNTYYGLVATLRGTYFTFYSKYGVYAGIQFKANDLDPIPDPDPSYSYSIARAYPNPFDTEMKLELNLEHPGYAKLEIFNLRGQQVLSRDYHELQAGRNLISWDGKDSKNRDCANGVYFIRMTDGTNTDIIKMLRLK